jgi:hypothetical protein
MARHKMQRLPACLSKSALELTFSKLRQGFRRGEYVLPWVPGRANLSDPMTLAILGKGGSVRAPAHTCVVVGLRAGVLPEASRRGIVGLGVVSHRNISPGPLIPTGRYG